MNIVIDQQEVAEAINRTVTKALSSSFEGYEVRSAIGNLISKEVANGAISEAIKLAIENIDTAAISQFLAEELQHASVRGVLLILQDGLLATVCKLRGIGEYSAEDKAERERIRCDLFKKVAG